MTREPRMPGEITRKDQTAGLAYSMRQRARQTGSVTP